MPEANPEIEDFIDRELRTCLETGRLALGDPSLVLAIRDALLDESQGMFLWTNLQIQSLCSMNTDKDIRDALARPPQSLGQTYARILQKTASELGTLERCRILKLITAALRPLTIDELREALSILPGDTTWSSERLPNEMISTLACCGPLLTIDEEERTIRLVHSSFKKFLLEDPEDSLDKFTLIEANDKLFTTIVTYLSYGVFDKQLSSAVIPQGTLQAAPTNIIRATLGPTYVRNMAIKLLQTRKTPDYDTGRIFLEGRKLAGNRIQQTPFQFYSYAHHYWFRHALEGQALAVPSYSQLVLKLIKESKIVINICDENGLNFLSMAASRGAKHVVRVLIDSGIAESQCDGLCNLKRTALSWASHNGHNDIVSSLLDGVQHFVLYRKGTYSEKRHCCWLQEMVT
jgi:hypothetical protein